MLTATCTLIDAVLRLDGARVRSALEELDLKLCADLVKHLEQGELRVGVTIRPGPDLEPEALVDLLHENVQNGALKATCFLLVQNCEDKESGERFRVLARKEDMHAASVVWPVEATVKELDAAITDAILMICTHPLPDDSSGTDDPALARASVGAKASRPRRARSSRPRDMGTT